MAYPIPGVWRSAFDLGLRKKVAIVFLGILLCAGLNLGLLHGMLQDFNGVAATATVAGKLRMLGQKLAFEAVSISSGLYEVHEGIERDIVDFEAAYLTLRSGGSAFSENIRPLSSEHSEAMNTVWLAWKQYREQLRSLLSAHTDVPLEALRERQWAVSASANVLLERTDILIADLVEAAQATQSRVLERMYGLLALNAMALLLVYLAVSRNFVEPLQKLARHCVELAKGNYGVRTLHTTKDEIGKLANALNQSGQKIGDLISTIEREQRALRRTSAMFQGVARNAVVGVFAIDENMRFRYVNRKLAEMFGYRSDEMVNELTVHDFLARQEDALRWERLALTRGQALATSHFETRGLHRSGRPIDIEIFASRTVLDAAPAIIGIVLNVTERKKAEASARRAALVYGNTSEAVVVTDPAGNIQDVNPAFVAITGYSLHELAGKRMNALSSGRHDVDFYRQMWARLEETGKWSGHVWNRRKSGEEYVERLTIDTCYNEDGSVNCRIGVFSDVTAERLKEETIWRQAHFDHLTGLPNRQMFHQQLHRAMQRCDGTGRSLAVIFMDLDLFKEVNDSLGHDKGDELLKEIAQRLSKAVRKDDVVARLGGDEFTLMLELEEDESLVEQVCERTLQAVAQPFRLGQHSVKVSASLGVTFYPRDATSATELLKSADLAMYSAKDGGRNQFRYFSMAMQVEIQQRRELLRQLEGAVERGEFELYFQPIINMETLQITKAEALIRWRHPQQGIVGPGDFIPLAEDSGLIVPIGDWVFREAAKHVAKWRQARVPGFQVSVNVSPVQFMSGELDPAAWLSCVNSLGLSGSAVLVEITERLLIRSDGEGRDKLLAFRDAGVQVALDDFGTGYSSLAYLKRFDIDYIKIDQLFVRNITTDPDDLALCQAIIVMAHRLGLKVVAEGVASPEQHEMLLRSGCDYAQGFLYSQPISVERFDALLQTGVQVGTHP
jgi:PAS domain S-box/diguanylate cyclase (GGDEF) domain